MQFVCYKLWIPPIGGMVLRKDAKQSLAKTDLASLLKYDQYL